MPNSHIFEHTNQSAVLSTGDGDLTGVLPPPTLPRERCLCWQQPSLIGCREGGLAEGVKASGVVDSDELGLRPGKNVYHYYFQNL